jgi:hypothetical protein
MGQKLRGLGIKHVRVRVNGFNAARLSTIKGITQVTISESWSRCLESFVNCCIRISLYINVFFQCINVFPVVS